MLSFKEIEEMLRWEKPCLEERFKVKKIAMFGSFVRDEQTEKSDLDLLVDFAEPVSLLDLAALEVHLSELLEIKVDVVPKEDVRSELKDTIFKEAYYL